MTYLSKLFLIIAICSLNAASPQTADISASVDQFPITNGSTWTYTTIENVQRDGLNCVARGRSVTTIVSVQVGARARVVKEEVSQSVISVTGDDGCRSRFASSNLGWTYVVVAGKVYGAALFNEELLTRALSEGAVPFEERGIAPKYVFPLQAGQRWSGKYDLYETRANAPIQTNAGNFDGCFKVIQIDKDYPDRRVEDIICSGVGIVSEGSAKPGYQMGIILTSYSIGK